MKSTYLGRSCRSLPAACRRRGAGSTTSQILKEHRSRERPKLFNSGLKTKLRSSRAEFSSWVPRSGAAECGSAMYLGGRREMRTFLTRPRMTTAVSAESTSDAHPTPDIPRAQRGKILGQNAPTDRLACPPTVHSDKPDPNPSQTRPTDPPGNRCGSRSQPTDRPNLSHLWDAQSTINFEPPKVAR